MDWGEDGVRAEKGGVYISNTDSVGDACDVERWAGERAVERTLFTAAN